jgi:hypothetical protein
MENNNIKITQEKFINSGFYGDVYDFDQDKVIKLFKKVEFWSKEKNKNIDDCILIQNMHFAIEVWMIKEAQRWNKIYFPLFHDSLINNIEIEPSITAAHIDNAFIIMEKLHGTEYNYSQITDTEHSEKINEILNYLEDFSKTIWDYGRVSPFDCAIFIDDNNNIKITDIGGWNDMKYTEFYNEHGYLSEEYRQELQDLKNKIMLN